MPGQSETVRVRVWVKGRVQGVGFRAYVESSARQMGVTGWVRNVGYDTVEAVAEGEREKINRFVEAVKMGPRGSHVGESGVESETPTDEFQSFQVRRSL